MHRYNTDYEKNSDYCVKAVLAIRVNPLPAGTIDPNWRKDAAELIANRQIVIFGNIR
jgi:hypothetical protein